MYKRLLLIVGLLLLSELVFLFSKGKIHLFIERICLSGASISFFEKKGFYECFDYAAGWAFRENVRDDIGIGSLEAINISDERLLDWFWDHVHQIDSARWFKGEEGDLSRLYFDMALKANELNDSSVTELLMRRSVQLSPDLSFYWVELANYYLVYEKDDLSREILNICMQRSYPRKHCGSFLTERVNHLAELPLGFSLDGISLYYQSKLVL